MIKKIAAATQYERKAQTEVYITPAEEFGLAESIPTEDLTQEEFSNLRKSHNVVKIKGDLSKYFPGKAKKDLPKTVSAAIGASAVSQILGTCTYSDSTIINLFRQMLGIEEKEISAFLQRKFDDGHFFEFLIAEEFCRRNYLTLLKPSGMLYLASNPRFYCNVDFFARDDETNEIYILEIKNPGGIEHQKEVHKRYDNNMEAEQMYIDQVLYQMYITGVHKGYVVYGWCDSLYARENYEIDSVYGFEVEYDQARVDLEVESVDKFIDAIINVDEKAVLELGGAQAKDFVLVFGEGEGELVTDKDVWKNACDKQKAADRRVKLAQKDLDEAEAELVKLMDGYNKAIIHNDIEDIVISKKVRESKSWTEDLEPKLREQAPDVLEKYTSFSITDAQLKKLPDETRELILSCRTVKRTPTTGIKIERKTMEE